MTKATVPATPSAPTVKYLDSTSLTLHLNLPSGNGLPIINWEVRVF